MVKVKATITTEVVRYIDEDINNHNEVKRKLLEKLAVDGYVNTKIDYIVITRENPPDPSDIDIDYYFDPDHLGFMYGRL